ncbi:hypothetical protein M0805_009450 [Coniferiporia weirii]|nr:hypothetical protein M0805_009450 [Coniferiporia weirii]
MSPIPSLHDVFSDDSDYAPGREDEQGASTLKISTSCSTPSDGGKHSDDILQTTLPILVNEEESGIISDNHRIWRRRILVQFITLCWCFILEGWNDGSTGPLLPRIQEFYGINYATVSLIFIFQCVGFIVGAVLNVHLTDRLGFGKTIVLGTAVQAAVYILIIPAPPFPVIVFAFSLYGFGTALQVLNAFVAGLNDPKKMAILHACYGSGALASPFVATQFAGMKHWSFHYFTTLGLAVQTTLTLVAVFKLRRQNEVLISCGLPPRTVGSSPHSAYRQIWGLKIVHLLSFFLLAYCGIEITIGSWAVTYIIHRTGGGPASGYVSSGFFGGLAAGRILLLWVTEKIGERRAIFVYAIIAIGLEIFIWAVPLLVPSAIAVSLVGVMLGPMFPIMMNQCGTFLPPHLLSGGIGWIVSFGLLGTALVPFMSGALADRFGVVSLQPLLIAMMLFMTLAWACINFDHWRSTRHLQRLAD